MEEKARESLFATLLLSTICASYSLYIADHGNFDHEIVKRQANAILESPYITNWGDWGNWAHCPFGSFVVGMQLKTEAVQGNGDDTALNAIRLFCSSPDYAINFVSITPSPEGPWGTWGSFYNCRNSAAVGFQIRSESSQGGGRNDDDTATNNMRLICSNDQVLEGDGTGWGSWTGPRSCLDGYYLCGIQTQVEPHQGKGDDTALNNVRMKCCQKPRPVNPATTCTPTDIWKTVLECDNTASRTWTQCTVQLKTGVSDTQSQSSTTSLSEVFTKTTEWGITASAGFQFGPISASLEARFGGSVGRSRTTGFDWRQATSSVFIQEKTTTTSKQVAPGEKLIIQQVVGICGRFSVKTNKFRIIDQRMQ